MTLAVLICSAGEDIVFSCSSVYVFAFFDFICGMGFGILSMMPLSVRIEASVYMFRFT